MTENERDTPLITEGDYKEIRILTLRVDKLKEAIDNSPKKENLEELIEKVNDVYKRVESLSEKVEDIEDDLEVLDRERRDTSTTRKRIIEQVVMLLIGTLIPIILSKIFM